MAQKNKYRERILEELRCLHAQEEVLYKILKETKEVTKESVSAYEKFFGNKEDKE